MKNYKLKLHFLPVIIGVCYLFFSCKAIAQITSDKIYQGITFDAVMIKEVRKGFDVNLFIERVKNDTTFYKAFKNLRLHSFTMYNDIEIVDKKDAIKATYNSITKQRVQQNCRKMLVEKEKITGDYYSQKKELNYYTAKLYEHLFFTKGTVCGADNIVGNAKQKGTTKYEEQLRMLIFNPGKRISGIPGLGDNMAIFEEPFRNKYDFKLSKQDYFGDSCYVFNAIPKKEYADEVVINELKTWFRASDFSIIARDYSLSYKTLFYDFDVVMKVKLKNTGMNLVPYDIQYKGNWHVFTKNREKASFTSIFTDFE
jgi:hypothetical protein